MVAQTVSMNTVNDFLAQKRIAIVGVSRQQPSLSISLFEEFTRRGYDMVPVNPNMPEFHGRRCFARLQDILPPVDAALLMTSPSVTEAVVKDCADAGIRRVWIYGDTIKKQPSPRVLQFCEEHGMQVVPGQCPYMFLPGAGGVHRFHGFIRKITGHFPQSNAG